MKYKMTKDDYIDYLCYVTHYESLDKEMDEVWGKLYEMYEKYLNLRDIEALEEMESVTPHIPMLTFRVREAIKFLKEE